MTNGLIQHIVEESTSIQWVKVPKRHMTKLISLCAYICKKEKKKKNVKMFYASNIILGIQRLGVKQCRFR